MVEILKTPQALRAWSLEQRSLNQTIALVPTMGYLHEGHLALVKEAQRRADKVVVSIFVNPIQFGPNEDLTRYPRDEEGDLHKLQNVDAVFIPDTMYPADFDTYVVPKRLTEHLCGPKRPGHFQGVCTVVALLFRISLCHVAVFGEKDFQQLQIIRRMTEDLWLDVEIIGMPIVREKDGLAKSSRNVYLSEQERAQALVLSQALKEMEQLVKNGEIRTAELLKHLHTKLLSQSLVKIDYAEIVDAKTLQPIDAIEDTAVCAIAAFVGKTRLIDNVVLRNQL